MKKILLCIALGTVQAQTICSSDSQQELIEANYPLVLGAVAFGLGLARLVVWKCNRPVQTIFDDATNSVQAQKDLTGSTSTNPETADHSLKPAKPFKPCNAQVVRLTRDNIRILHKQSRYREQQKRRKQSKTDESTTTDPLATQEA